MASSGPSQRNDGQVQYVQVGIVVLTHVIDCSCDPVRVAENAAHS